MRSHHAGEKPANEKPGALLLHSLKNADVLA